MSLLEQTEHMRPEAGADCAREQQPDFLEQAAYLVFDIATDADQPSPSDEQGPDRLAVVALDADLAIPPHPDQFSQAAGVVWVALVHSYREGGMRMSGVDADNG